MTRIGRPPSARKHLREALTELPDDGTGRVHPALTGLLENLASMPEPARGSTWLRNNANAWEYLRGHRPRARAAAAPVHHLAPAAPDARRAARHSLGPGARNSAADRFAKARKYLGWLASRGRQLPDTIQADIDTWYATQPQPDVVRGFLKWAMTSHHMPRLGIPAGKQAHRPPVSQHRGLALLHRFLTDQRIPLRTRVAGCLLLLYAQPVARLVRLSVNDIITSDDDQVSIRLGSPPTPVPAPFAAMLTELAANRVNMNTATNPACQWLFPGQRRPPPRSSPTLSI